MRYYWLREKESKNLFEFYWDKSENNHADYFTKYHCAKHHSKLRPKFVHDKNNRTF